MPTFERATELASLALRRSMLSTGLRLVHHAPHRPVWHALPEEIGAYEWIQQALISRMGINCVIDVGAHAGEYGQRVRRAGYEGAVVSFEPVASAYAALTDRAARDPNWTAHRIALGSAAGSATMHVSRESVFSSFMEVNDFATQSMPTSVIAADEEVEVQRLDELFDRVCGHVPNPRVLLKTDTQGWDLEVIEGARGCLEHVVALQAELSVRPIYEGQIGWLEALAALEREGFRPVHLATVTRDAALGVVEFDYLGIRD
jgi:FkbM family methyltransferase